MKAGNCKHWNGIQNYEDAEQAVIDYDSHERPLYAAAIRAMKGKQR